MYKKMLFIALMTLGLSGVVFADDFDDGVDAPTVSANSNPGFYLGAQFGGSDLHYGGSSYTSATSYYEDGYKFAGRAYAGYAFSEFISVELGYDYYGRPKFKSTKEGSRGNTQDVLQHGLDIVGKATLPLDYGFGLYMKGGLAWVYRSALNSNDDSFVTKPANNKFPLVGGVGVNYWFAPHMALDLSWTKTTRAADLPTSDLFMLGFIYKINL